MPGTMTLAWITHTPGCVVQESADFGSTNWSSVTNPVSVVGSNAVVTVPVGTGAKFYRLKLP